MFEEGICQGNSTESASPENADFAQVVVGRGNTARLTFIRFSLKKSSSTKVLSFITACLKFLRGYRKKNLKTFLTNWFLD